MRIGHGYDVHRLVPGRKLILGGVEIPFERGLDGHSDADVLTHALMDALLGAACLGDIGLLFPDNDPQYKGISSLLLLEEKQFLLGQLAGILLRHLERLHQGIGQARRRHQRNRQDRKGHGREKS